VCHHERDRFHQGECSVESLDYDIVISRIVINSCPGEVSNGEVRVC
jgi:hypothetical protein